MPGTKFYPLSMLRQGLRLPTLQGSDLIVDRRSEKQQERRVKGASQVSTDAQAKLNA